MKLELKMLDKYFAEKRTFSKFEAAVFILSECSKSGGELSLSLAELAAQFSWANKMAVSRFLAEMQRDGLLSKVGAKYKITNKALPPAIERIEVESIEVEKVEMQIPTFTYTPVPARDGVPPTKEQLMRTDEQQKPQVLIDISKINWEEGMKVPKLRLYKRYIDACKGAYAVQESDSDALDMIVKNMENTLRDYFKKSDKNYNKNELLSAIDRFVQNMEGTFYFGRSLDTIAKHYNNVAADIKNKLSKVTKQH